MSAVRVVVANEPRAYREAIAAAFGALRPRAEVSAAEPKDLDLEVQRRVPRLVVCSRLTSLVEREVPAWVLLYPAGASHAWVCLEGERTRYPGMNLSALLSVMDEAQRLDGSG